MQLYHSFTKVEQYKAVFKKKLYLTCLYKLVEADILEAKNCVKNLLRTPISSSVF